MPRAHCSTYLKLIWRRQRVVIRWMYWDCRRKSTAPSGPLTVTLPFQCSGCQHWPQGSDGGQQSVRSRSTLSLTFHANNLQGLRIMTIELERIWPDLGLGRPTVREFRQSGLILQSAAAGCLYQTHGHITSIVCVCGWKRQAAELVHCFCVWVLLTYRNATMELAYWGDERSPTDCADDVTWCFSFPAYRCFRPSPKRLPLVKVITSNICVKRMVRLEWNLARCVGGGL